MLGDAFHKQSVWHDALVLVKRVYALADLLPESEKSLLVATLKKQAVTLPAKVAAAFSLADDAAFTKAIDGVETCLQELDAMMASADALGFAPKRAIRKVRKTCVAYATQIAQQRPDISIEQGGAPPLRLAA